MRLADAASCDVPRARALLASARGSYEAGLHVRLDEALYTEAMRGMEALEANLQVKEEQAKHRALGEAAMEELKQALQQRDVMKARRALVDALRGANAPLASSLCDDLFSSPLAPPLIKLPKR